MDHQDQQIAKGISAFDSGEYGSALSYLLPLAQSGNAKAQCYLAAMYQSGLGVEIDGVHAVQWYLKAADQRMTEDNISGLAFHNLATIYITGSAGVEPNKQVAQRYLREAALLGVNLEHKR